MNTYISDDHRKLLHALILLIVIIAIVGLVDWDKIKCCKQQLCCTQKHGYSGEAVCG